MIVFRGRKLSSLSTIFVAGGAEDMFAENRLPLATQRLSVDAELC